MANITKIICIVLLCNISGPIIMTSSLIQNQSLSTELLYDYKSILDYEKVIKRIFYAEDKNYNNYKTVYHIGMNREAKK